jgi:hypothetical protein
MIVLMLFVAFYLASMSITIFQKGKKSGESDKKLLDNVWGEVPEKQTTAIMGPRYVMHVTFYDAFQSP